MTILILGAHEDEHAMVVQRLLTVQGHDAELLDSRWFPAQLRLAFDPRQGDWVMQLPTGRVLKSGNIRAVYWRCYNGVGSADLPDPEQAYIAQNDSRGLFESWLIHAPLRWVNGWTAFQMHQTKPVQLAAVAARGVPIPATVLGNDAGAIREFAARQPQSIFKPVQGGAHTRRVAAHHLSDANLANLAIAPVTLQEEIPGTNIRVFVAGERVLACEVRAETVDFRDVDDPTIVVHALPEAIRTQAREIARTLHLVWTGIDYRLTPEGRYVFLEANPSPMFLGFEARSGLPLTEALLQLLTKETT
jgi:glutathione synthase/RimK-type ligase-like ATP-grasp enzyme